MAHLLDDALLYLVNAAKCFTAIIAMSFAAMIIAMDYFNIAQP